MTLKLLVRRSYMFGLFIVGKLFYRMKMTNPGDLYLRYPTLQSIVCLYPAFV